MAYRDDQDALHERVQQMEQDLERARREAAEGKQAQHEVEALHKALEKAQRELERLRRPPPPTDALVQKRRVALIAGMAAAVVMLAGAGAAVFLMSASPRTASQPPPPSVPARPAAAVPAPPPPPASQPRVDPTQAEQAPSVRGDIDREVIRRVFRQATGAVRRCYESALQQNPSLAGRVVVKLTIGATGQVVLATVQSSTLKHSEVESCILAVMRGLAFPKPPGGGIVVVTYPFVFRTAP
jgi:TonB family protein